MAIAYRETVAASGVPAGTEKAPAELDLKSWHSFVVRAHGRAGRAPRSRTEGVVVARWKDTLPSFVRLGGRSRARARLDEVLVRAFLLFCSAVVSVLRRGSLYRFRVLSADHAYRNQPLGLIYWLG